MGKYSCHKCEKNFDQKHHLVNHLNKKNACDKLVDREGKKRILCDEIEIDVDIDAKKIRESLDEYKCAFCDKQFTQKGNVVTHMKNNCKKKRELDNSREDKNKLIMQIRELKKENEEIKINFKTLEKHILEKINKNVSVDNLKKEMQDELKEIKVLKENLKLKEKLNQIDIGKDDNLNIKKKKEKIPQKMRMMVWDKYIGLDKGKSKCKCCNDKEITQMDFECGHIIAEANGGKITIDNLLPICGPCNRSMKTDNLFVFQKKLEIFKNE
jgi:hypothetical protein